MTDAVNGSTVLATAKVAWRDVGGEVVILDAKGERILGLNRTGGAMWKLLDGVRTLANIADAIAAEEQGVEHEQVLGDVLAFARTLVERKLAQTV